MNLNKVNDVLFIIGRFHSIWETERERERERESVCMCLLTLRKKDVSNDCWSLICMYKRDLLEKKSGVDTRIDASSLFFLLIRATLAKKGLGTESEIGEVTRSHKHILN